MTEPEHLYLISHSPEETQSVGESIGRRAEPGDVYLLMGKLGSGKTTLTQGVARGLGVKENVSSPSFVLIREMKGRLALYHIDLYRLDRLEEVAELGLDGYLYSGGVSVIEWGDKGVGVLPEEHLLIALSYISEDERTLNLEAKGGRYREILRHLKATLA